MLSQALDPAAVQKTPINEMGPISIEDWLSELGSGVHKLANRTRLQIRNINRVAVTLAAGNTIRRSL